MVGRNSTPERVFVALVSDRPGVLSKIADVFFRRGINIITLTVGASHRPDVSKIVIRCDGRTDALRRLALLLENLVDVLDVEVVDPEDGGIFELCLARMRAASIRERNEIVEKTVAFRPRIALTDRDSIVLELIDSPATIDHFVHTLGSFELVDISRTGVTTTPASISPLELDDDSRQ